jgi:hypothetical protein
MDKYLFKVSELVDAFGVTKMTVSRWVKDGGLATDGKQPARIHIKDFCDFYHKHLSYFREGGDDSEMNPRDLKDLYNGLLAKLEYYKQRSRYLDAQEVLAEVKAEYAMLHNQITKNYVTMVKDVVSISDEKEATEYLQKNAAMLCESLRLADVLQEKVDGAMHEEAELEEGLNEIQDKFEKNTGGDI